MEEFKIRVLPVKNKMYRLALRYLRDEDEAKDMVQDVFLKIWQKKEDLSGYNNIEAWCTTLTRNLCLDKIKSGHYQAGMRKTESTEIMLESHSPLEKAAHADTMALLDQLVDQLPDKQKLVFQLRDVNGYSYKEISEMTMLDMNQVKVNLFRARQYLKEKIIKTESYGL